MTLVRCEFEFHFDRLRNTGSDSPTKRKTVKMFLSGNIDMYKPIEVSAK